MIYTKAFAYGVIFFSTTNLIALKPGTAEQLKREEEQMQSWFNQMEQYKTFDILDKKQKTDYIKICKARPNVMPIIQEDDSISVDIMNARGKDSSKLKSLFSGLVSRLSGPPSFNSLKQDVDKEMERVNKAIILEKKITEPKKETDKWYTTINIWYPKVITLLKETVDNILPQLTKQKAQQQEQKKIQQDDQTTKTLASLSNQSSNSINNSKPIEANAPKKDVTVDSVNQWDALEKDIIDNNKELLPQFKTIKSAAMALVYFVNNKNNADYMKVRGDAKGQELNTMLSDLENMQKTKFEKKFFLSKKKAVGKKIDSFLERTIWDIKNSLN